MERWKKHRVMALLLAMLLFLSAGLSSWSSRAEDLSEDTQITAEVTDESPAEVVQPTPDETDLDAPAEAPAEEEPKDEPEEEIAPPIPDEDVVPAEEKAPAEEESAPAEETPDPSEDPAQAETEGSDELPSIPGLTYEEYEEIVSEGDGVILIKTFASIVMNANPDPSTSMGGHTLGSEYVQNMGRSNLDSDTVVFTHKDANGKVIESNPMVMAGRDQYTNAICARFAGSPGEENYEFDVNVSEVTEKEARQLIYGLVNAINQGQITYGQAHRMLCYALGNGLVTIGAMPDPKKNNTEYDAATAAAPKKHKLISSSDLPSNGINLINTYKSAAIPANVDFTAYFLKQDTGTSTNWGTYQDFISWSLIEHADKYYCAAIYKQNDNDEPMNDVTFDIGVNCGRTTTDTGLKTGTFYNYVSKISYKNHTYSTDTNPAPIEDGILVIYLGLVPANDPQPTCYVEENWIDEGHVNNNGRGYVKIFAGDTLEEAEKAATNYAKKKLADVTWTNTRTVSLTVTKDFDAAAKLCLESKRPNGTKWMNPNYSLEGAVYAVYATKENAENKKNPSATFTTNKDGVGIVTFVTGYMTGMGTTTLSHLGQHEWYVREVTAPKGLQVDNTVHELLITKDTTTNLVFDWKTTDKLAVDPIQISINKVNAAGNVVAGNGGKTLEGAQFTMKFWPYDVTENYTESDFRKWMAQGWEPQRTWVFETKLEEGEYRVRYDDPFKVSGDDLFYAPNGDPGLPLGWVTIEETKAPDGFTLSGGKWTFKASDGSETNLGSNMLIAKTTDNGRLLVGNVDLTSGTLNNSNTPERTDIELQKNDENGDPMEGVFFKITNTDTGESHIVATDANGYFSTAASYQKHSENTGYYDDGKDYDGTKAGVWFAKNKTGDDTPVSDDYGALCPGTYTIEELESDANKDMQYEVAKTFTITGKETEAIAFTFVNVPGPKFTTELLCDLTGSHTIADEPDQTLTDTVHYTNLKANTTYTLRSQLMLIDEDGNISEYGAAVTKTFTTAAKTAEEPSDFCKSGDETITFTGVNGADVVDKQLVSYQRLYLGDNADDQNPKQYDGYPAGSYMGTLFPMVEEDPTNALQMVTAVTGHTEAGGEDGNKLIPESETVTIIDHVYYNGLIIGKEYTVKGTLYIRPEDVDGTEEYTDEELASMQLLDADGHPVTASTTFTAEESEGSVDIAFTFDSALLHKEATTIVAFEEMMVKPGDIRVFTHADIHDREQTVYIPAIGTMAKSIDERDEKLLAFDDGNFIDTVAYENLEPETTYTIRGVVMDKATGEALVLNGKTVTAEETFTTGVSDKWNGAADGKTDVHFTITPDQYDDLKGKDIVVFETVYKDEVKIVSHNDLADEGQELLVPDIGTTLTDEVTKTHISYPDEVVTLVDVVEYKNLIPGREYEMTGVLYDQETGEPLLDEEGNEITGTSGTFTAGETGAGTVEVRFTFNGKLLMVEGKSVVAFEYCKTIPGNRTVAAHTDIHDREQTVDFPKVGTKAGLATAEDGKITITDTIQYENLIPGRTYVAKAVLMKPDGLEATADGVAITAELRFTPVAADGTVDVTFPAFAPEWEEILADEMTLETYAYSYVVFEEIFIEVTKEDGTTELHIVGEHEDLTDTLQTVNDQRTPEIGTTLTDEVTKTHISYPDEVVTLVDVVEYENLVPGKEYEMTGVLYDQETGEPLLDEEGNEITGTSGTFTAGETGAGTVEVRFTFNGKLLMVEGKSVVAFEYCKTIPGNRTVAFHTDINDKEQTVDFPKVGTKASITGKTVDDGTKKLTAIEVTDVLSYENLQPGLTYIIRASLMKPDGTPAMADGKAITAEKKFSPAEADGTESITFASFAPEWILDYDITEVRTTEDGRKYDYNMKGWSFKYVVFEEVYVVKDGEEHLIGEHKNLEDVSQTITDTQKEEGGEPTPTTGDGTPIFWFSMMFLLSACGIAFILWRKRKNQ